MSTKVLARLTELIVTLLALVTPAKVPRCTETPLENCATYHWIVRAVRLVSFARTNWMLVELVSCPRTWPSPGSVLFPRRLKNRIDEVRLTADIGTLTVCVVPVAPTAMVAVPLCTDAIVAACARRPPWF